MKKLIIAVALLSAALIVMSTLYGVTAHRYNKLSDKSVKYQERLLITNFHNNASRIAVSDRDETIAELNTRIEELEQALIVADMGEELRDSVIIKMANYIQFVQQIMDKNGVTYPYLTMDNKM